MRKLHFVGLTADLEGLVFTARKGSKSGGYLVPLDATLLDTIAEAHRRRTGETIASPSSPLIAAPAAPAFPGPPSRHESSLTPREMQARLRAGRTVDEVAAEAGVAPDWVQRFAVPIIAEQAKVVDLGRSLTYSKPRLGESSRPLAGSVSWNLSERAVWLGDDQFDQSWNAYQLHDSVWMIRFRYRSRGREQDALWELDMGSAQLLARNRLAAELGYVEKGRRRRDAALGPGSDGDGDEVGGNGAAPPARTDRTEKSQKTEKTEKPAKAVRAAKTAKAPALAKKAGRAQRTTKAAPVAGPAKSARRPAAAKAPTFSPRPLPDRSKGPSPTKRPRPSAQPATRRSSTAAQATPAAGPVVKLPARPAPRPKAPAPETEGRRRRGSRRPR
ncbi:MAG: septation protein SepH [Acidimicrobiales bacterium]